MGRLTNKNGFTMVSVGIIVVVMLLLVSIVTVSAVSSISNAKKINFAADIVYIQDEVDNYYMKSGYTSYPTGNSITVDLTYVDGTIRSNQFVGEDIDVNNKVMMNEIDFDAIGIKQHVYGNNEDELDKYVVSTKTGKVYYIAGIKAGGTTYYTITSDLNKEYKRKSVLKSTEVAIEDVILELSTVDYTNSPVTVKVKLPKEYTYSSVTASDSKLVASETTVGNYKEMDINYTGDTRDGNYSIVVSYTKNEIVKKVTYVVSNFDNTIPELLATPTVVSSRNASDGKFSADIVLPEAIDNLSGIKTIKYAEENILLADAKIYFENNGSKVTGNKIEIKKYPVYTIYIEDNASNCAVYSVNIEQNILTEIQ